MTVLEETPSRVRWARLRFSVVGPLLHSPPAEGELRQRLEELSARTWRHPTTGEPVRFGLSTIERWFYDAKGASNPIEALARKVPTHAGKHPSMPEALLAKLRIQHQQHPRWSFQLHHDNLAALVRADPALGPMPSYTTVCRVMKSEGLLRRKGKRRRHHVPGEGEEFVPREQRSWEVEHVLALWHSDFHLASRRVLTDAGTYAAVVGLGVLDDRSRLACHLQWYFHETAETVTHGWSQALQKRGLPRGMLTDNGKPFLAAEVTEGLSRLSISHYTTLPHSPEQNGKQESFWGQVEGRLLAMLEAEKPLTLDVLNAATQAWVELEYNRATHSELGRSPLEVFMEGPSVGRPSLSSDVLRRAFRVEQKRKQRRSDGTVSVEGVRFELPSRYRTLLQPTVRFARWDLSSVDLVDPRTGRHLATLLPLDKAANADRRRRALATPNVAEPSPPPAGIAPRLRELMAEYAATGMPPAYVPFPTTLDGHEGDSSDES